MKDKSLERVSEYVDDNITTNIDTLKQRLAQSEQYRRMVADQHADAKHNIAYHERKLAEAIEQESEMEHRLGMLDTEAEMFRKQIIEAERLEAEESGE